MDSTRGSWLRAETMHTSWGTMPGGVRDQGRRAAVRALSQDRRSHRGVERGRDRSPRARQADLGREREDPRREPVRSHCSRRRAFPWRRCCVPDGSTSCWSFPSRSRRACRSNSGCRLCRTNWAEGMVIKPWDLEAPLAAPRYVLKRKRPEFAETRGELAPGGSRAVCTSARPRGDSTSSSREPERRT